MKRAGRGPGTTQGEEVGGKKGKGCKRRGQKEGGGGGGGGGLCAEQKRKGAGHNRQAGRG